jgi:hypothetical protein
VRFKAVGNAPIMKQNFYKITASNRFQAVIQFLRKELAWKAGDPLVSPFFVIPMGCLMNDVSGASVHVYQSGVFPCARRYCVELVQGMCASLFPDVLCVDS